jgi:hypothetical protein
LTTETSRAITSESALTTSLTAEANRAITAESALTAVVTSETNRATAAEATKEDIVNKSINVTTDGTSDNKYPSVKSVKTYVDAQIISGATPDATTIVIGKIQLAGDLAGTASAPVIKIGAIDNTKISATAGIFDTQLATISTVGKVSNSATTATTANTASTIVARGASGNFSAGAITATSLIIPGGTSLQYLMADGSVSAGSAAIREVADEFTASLAQASFTLSQTPSLNSKVKMYINGIRISNTAYSVSGSTLSYVPANNGSYAVSVNDRIQFDYYY